MAPSCQLNCENLKKNCTEKTVPLPGCYCKQGFVENCNDECVPEKSYCQLCDNNKHYSDCGSKPEASCKNPNTTTTSTGPGCVCDGGFVRDYDDNCIQLSKCPCKLYFKLI